VTLSGPRNAGPLRGRGCLAIMIGKKRGPLVGLRMEKIVPGRPSPKTRASGKSLTAPGERKPSAKQIRGIAETATLVR